MAGRPASEPLDLLLVVRSLDIGGAERQLVVLARGLAKRGRRVAVAVFYRGGALEAELASAGINVIDLQKRGRWDLFGFLGRFRRLLRTTRPRVVHGYLPVPNLLALTAKLWWPTARVVWGVRDAGMNLPSYDRTTRITFRVASFLSRWADIVIVNSEAGRERHLAYGYPAQRTHLISNGIDTNRFQPPERSGTALRADLNLPQGVPLVGCVARLDPVKGIDLLLAAMQSAHQQGWRGHLVLVGGGSPLAQVTLSAKLARSGLGEMVSWREREPRLVDFYGALDALCLPSYSEGFSNVLAEAMASGVRCIASDVGDAARILMTSNDLFPAGNDETLTRLLLSVREGQGQVGGVERREQIVANFSIDRLVNTSDQLLFGPTTT